MTYAPTALHLPKRRIINRLGVVAVVGALLGAVLISQFGPNPAYFPKMAALPFAKADGAQIYVQAREVTVAEWNRCHAAGSCTLKLRPPAGHEGQDFPATGLNWIDVNEYLTWINDASGHTFRLPTSDEWAAMAEPVIPAKPDPIFTDPELTWASAYLIEGLVGRKLEPSGSFASTLEGIDDLNGNVWEWTQDCYAGASDRQRIDPDACPAFVVGGEHEAVIPFLVRDPARGGCAVGAPPPHLGMRLISDRPLPTT